jgi:hypothetical protein
MVKLTKFGFDQTSYALYFGRREYMFLQKSVTSIKKGSQFIGTWQKCDSYKKLVTSAMFLENSVTRVENWLDMHISWENCNP